MKKKVINGYTVTDTPPKSGDTLICVEVSNPRYGETYCIKATDKMIFMDFANWKVCIKKNNMLTKYFDIHVNEGGGEGYSIPISFATDSPKVSDNDVIDTAIIFGNLDADDSPYVDTVREIDEAEYNQMKNI